MTFPYFVALILVAVVIGARGGGAPRLFQANAAVSLFYLVVTVVLAWLSPTPEPNPAVGDTYYILDPRHAARAWAIYWAGLAAILWLQARFDAIYCPRTTKWVFWGLTLLMVTTRVTHAPAGWYISAGERGGEIMQNLWMFNAYASQFQSLFLIAFAALALHALIRRLVRGPAGVG